MKESTQKIIGISAIAVVCCVIGIDEKTTLLICAIANINLTLELMRKEMKESEVV